jgi:hypothetical protein
MTSSTSNMALSAMVVADASALLMPDGSLVTPLPTGVSKAQILAAIDELEERANDTELALRARGTRRATKARRTSAARPTCAP